MASAEYPQNVGARVPNGISRISPKCGSTSTEWHQQNIPKMWEHEYRMASAEYPQQWLRLSMH
jgi:hypothetical protein